MAHKILVVTEGPPPLGDTPAEGGALRAWGLAKGLASNGHNVTLAYRSTFKLADNAASTKIPDKISLKTWDGTNLDRLLEEHKIIVLRYAMGEAEEFTRRLTNEHILVSDSYIPISIEVSARNSTEKDEHENYLWLQEVSAIASRRADYFLYASPAQKKYYLGYLAALNKINPITYPLFTNRLFEVPYGVDKNEIPNKYRKPSTPKTPTLLWYGAFYSWFDMESLIAAIKQLKQEMPNFKLLIAGAKNPYNQNPALLEHYNKTMSALEVLGETVEMIGWTPFDKRFEIYNRASAIITFNHLGLENELAWRTRLMDYLLAYKPIITNGGDPLGDDLIERGIAYRANEKAIVEVFKNILNTQQSSKAYDEAIHRYSWVEITKNLSNELRKPSRLPEVKMVRKVHPARKFAQKSKRVAKLPMQTIRYTKKHGVSKTLQRIKKA